MKNREGTTKDFYTSWCFDPVSIEEIQIDVENESGRPQDMNWMV
jgi:hypothetical protein